MIYNRVGPGKTYHMKRVSYNIVLYMMRDLRNCFMQQQLMSTALPGNEGSVIS